MSPYRMEIRLKNWPTTDFAEFEFLDKNKQQLMVTQVSKATAIMNPAIHMPRNDGTGATVGVSMVIDPKLVSFMRVRHLKQHTVRFTDLPLTGKS